MELTSLINCSISGSTDCSSEEGDSSSEALWSSLEDDDCGDLSLVVVSNFESFGSPCLNILLASPVEEPDFRGRARFFVELVYGVAEVPTRPCQHEFLGILGKSFGERMI